MKKKDKINDLVAWSKFQRSKHLIFKMHVNLNIVQSNFNQVNLILLIVDQIPVSVRICTWKRIISRSKGDQYHITGDCPLPARQVMWSCNDHTRYSIRSHITLTRNTSSSISSHNTSTRNAPLFVIRDRVCCPPLQRSYHIIRVYKTPDPSREAYQFH